MVNWQKYEIKWKQYRPAKNYILFSFSPEVIPCKEEEASASIGCVNSYPFNTYNVGDWLEIDWDKTALESKSHIFNDTSVVRKVTPTNIITTRGSSSNIVISPSLANAMGSSETMELARHMSRMVDENDKEYELKIEDNSNKRFTYSLICRKQK